MAPPEGKMKKSKDPSGSKEKKKSSSKYDSKDKPASRGRTRSPSSAALKAAKEKSASRGRVRSPSSADRKVAKEKPASRGRVRSPSSATLKVAKEKPTSRGRVRSPSSATLKAAKEKPTSRGRARSPSSATLKAAKEMLAARERASAHVSSESWKVQGQGLGLKKGAVAAGGKAVPAGGKGEFDAAAAAKKKKKGAAEAGKDKGGGKDKSAAGGGKGGRRGAPEPTAKKDKAPHDYLGDMDLPSSDGSETEGSEDERGAGEDPRARLPQGPTAREAKKIAEKQRKVLEKVAAAKAVALRDDDDAFDVAFERQGEEDATLSATDVIVHNLTIRAKGKVLLENTSLTIAAGRRYGLVGPNGKGKSTLLRLLAKRQIPVPETLDVLLVEQEVVGTDQSALASVVAADVELVEARREEAELTSKLAALDVKDGAADGGSAGAPAGAPAEGGEDGEDGESDVDDLGERLTAVYERLNELGSATAEARASRILHGLGFTEVMQRRATNLFSGGWRMRISLARALFIQPTLLLLDEPTNHLDLRAVLWLEEYLQRWRKTLVVVSHDRDFLNAVTTDIVHLHDERLHAYRGNFASFTEMYEQRRREANKEYERYTKQMRAAKRSGSKASADKVAKDAKFRAQKGAKGGGGGKKGGAADDDDAGLAGGGAGSGPRQWNDYTVRFEFPTPPELPPPLLMLQDVSFKYPGREDFAMHDLNLGIDMGSRVAIVGPNGAGKTTLMNLIAGDLEPTEGDSRRSHKLRVGRYAQHFVDALSFDETPVEYLLSRFPEAGLKPEEMRARLGRFGLSGHHHLQPICKLSGGQKARVVFAAISLAQPHVLLLDEPTNHLDMQSIDALADAIQEFDGGVVVISHDSRLLSVISDDAERAEVWVVEDGTVARYDGDFEEYKGELIKEIATELDEE